MKKAVWLMSAGMFALAAPAHAQDNTTNTGQTSPVEQAGEVNPNVEVDPTDDGPGEEIVVTAQGRRQVLQDVPIAVTAIGAESLQNSGATDIRQLNQLAPSLLVSSTGTEANGSARIRGIGTVGDNPGLESSVAVFIDGVYRSRTGIGLNELGEIERVEVLRGPQGTLFGRNASAGLINIISKKPNMNEMEGYAEATYGNYDFLRLGGGITGPIGGTGFGYRLEGIYVQRDGFYRVDNPQGGTESRVNDRDRFFLRGQLMYEPSDTLEIRLIADYTKRQESCCGAVYLSTAETFDPTPGALNTNVEGDVSVRNNRIVDVLRSLGETFPNGDDPYRRLISVSPGRTYRGDTQDYGFSAQVDWDLGAAALTSITGYRDYKAEGPSDTDYSRVDILFRDDDGNSFRSFETFSQELRLQGTAFNDRLDWLVGAYFAKEDLHLRDNLKFGSQYGAFAACRLVATVAPVAALQNPAAPGCLSQAALLGPTSPFGPNSPFGAARGLLIAGLNRLSTVNNVGDNNANYFQDSRNYALFTHNIFKITDQLSLTLGLRYTNEKKEFQANFTNTNTACQAQQAFFAPFLTGGAAALPGSGVGGFPATSLQGLAQGLVNLTCQGNSSAALNGLNLEDERSEDEFTGTAILSYKPNNDLLLYASYAKGYKAGGFNLDRSALGSPVFAPNDPRNFGGRGAPFGTENLQFDAEKVDAYELGMKYGRRSFNVNLALFRQEFKNFQLNTFNGSVFLVQNVNGCASQLLTTDSDNSSTTGACDPGDVEAGVISQGVELEAAIFPVPDMALTAGVTYAKTKFRRDLVGRDTGAPLDPALFLLPGDNLSNAPETVVTGSFTYTPDFGTSGLSGLFYVDARYTSAFNTGSDLFPEKQQESFILVNARVGIRGADQRWSAELWAQNLFNVDYQQVAFNSPFQGSGSSANVAKFGGTANQLFSSFLAEPRTYGVTVRTRF